MGAQKTKNCHYIPQFLIKAWETNPGQLTFYDFDKDLWRKGTSRRLFSENEIYSQELESWLNRNIEKPSADARRRLQSGDLAVLQDWGFVKAFGCGSSAAEESRPISRS